MTEVAEAEPGRAWTARVAAGGPARVWVRAGAVAEASGDGEGVPVVLMADVDAEGNATPVAEPAVIAVTIAEPADRIAWQAGEDVTALLTFSEAVTVDATEGTSDVGLAADGAQQRAAYRGAGGTVLRFAWTVPAGGSVAHVALAADSQALGWRRDPRRRGSRRGPRAPGERARRGAAQPPLDGPAVG